MTERVSDEERVVSEGKLQWLRHEVAVLKDALRAEAPLCAISSVPVATDKPESSPAKKPVPKKLVGPYIEGQRLPLSKLAESLKLAFDGNACLEHVDWKILICDVAERRFYGPKTGKDEVPLDKFEDESWGEFWFWELRSCTLLGENLKTKAYMARLKRGELQKRLSAVLAVVRWSEQERNSKTKWTTAKVKNALEKLDGLADLPAINEKYSDDAELESVKRIGKRMKRDRDVEIQSSAKKDSKRPAMQETNKSEKQIASGSRSVKRLKNPQRTLKCFFETPLKIASPSKPVMGELKIAGKPLLACPENKRYPIFQDSLHPEFLSRLTFVEGDISVMDAQLDSHPSPYQLRYEFVTRCQTIGNDPIRHKSLIYGAPATWARQPDYSLNFEAECEKLFGSEWKGLEISPVRMKYLWFTSDSDCPPFFGPFPKAAGLSARNPFIKAPGLDYDELFDEGWEEDPGGESLSVEDDEDDDKGVLSDDEEGFIVKDGYLSEDEGMGTEMDIDETCSASSFSQTDAEPMDATAEASSTKNLESWIKSSAKSGQPVLFTKLEVMMPPSKNWAQGDAEMLESLKAIPLSSDKISLKKKP